MPKNLLVVDPVPTNRIRLATTLSGAHYDVETAASQQDVPSGFQPDLVVLASGAQPPETISQLRAMPGLEASAPIVCLDDELSPIRRLAALRAGAREVLPRNFAPSLLLARLRNLIRECDTTSECERRRVAAASFGFSEPVSDFRPASRIGLLGANSANEYASILGSLLSHKIDRLTAQNVLRGDAAQHSPDAYVISCQSADEVENLLPELRERSHLRHAAVLVLYPDDDHQVATLALNLGASDIAARSSTGEELALRIEGMLQRKHMRDSLRSSDEQSYRAATTDPLTGLYNRRYAESYLADTLMQAQQTGHTFVMLLADIDHFKAVNDTHGHAVGDAVLCAVADRLRANVRACDLVSRYGGEEFLIVMPETSVIEAGHTAERLRAALSSMPINLSDAKRIPVTVSIGVAEGHLAQNTTRSASQIYDFPNDAATNSFAALLADADKALYRAKAAGRNRVVFSAA